MTTIPSWNIQAGLGVDGRVDLARIARTVRALADADVKRAICMSTRAIRGTWADLPGTLPVETALLEDDDALYRRYAAVDFFH